MNNNRKPAESHDEGRAALSLREIQVIGFDILLALDEFCKKHGLRYYLCGGTLLGAVRHKGFIPWDDDVDIFMSRPDYERMIEICRTETIREDLRFACPQNGGFMRPFARIYYEKTVVDRRYLNEDSGASVWLDILPVDGMPDSYKARKRLYTLRHYLNRFNMITFWKPGTGTKAALILRRYLVYPIALLIGSRRWVKMLEHLGKKRPFETSPTVGCVTAGRYGPGEAMPRSGYEKSAKVLFEGREFETMSCYREYLTGIYGDYMALPKEEDRCPHLDYTTMPRKDLEELHRKYSHMFTED